MGKAADMVDKNFRMLDSIWRDLKAIEKMAGGGQTLTPMDVYYFNPTTRGGERARATIARFENELLVTVSSSKKIAAAFGEPDHTEAMEVISRKLSHYQDWANIVMMDDSERKAYCAERDARKSSFDNWFRSVYQEAPCAMTPA